MALNPDRFAVAGGLHVFTEGLRFGEWAEFDWTVAVSGDEVPDGSADSTMTPEKRNS
jgi:hypothetical protein